MESTELQPQGRLGIYQIAAQMAELIQFAETAETEQEYEAAQAALRQYIDVTEVERVENVARAIKYLQRNVGTSSSKGLIDEEIERLRRAKLQQSRVLDFIKGVVISIMRIVGRDKLTHGATVLRLQNNPPRVEITSPHLIPSEYVRLTVSMSASAYAGLPDEVRQQCQVTATEYDLAGISKACLVAEKTCCATCGAVGRLCPECGGDGRSRFPGARLVRDQHLRVQ